MFRCTIRHGRWSAAVIPSCAANLVSLRYDDEAILREPCGMIDIAREPFLFGIPILMPANRTKNGIFAFKHRKYHLPINEPDRLNNLHGSLYKAEFDAIYKTDNIVSCRFRNLRTHYPFAFEMQITDALDDEGLTRTIRITALEDMPYTLAFHNTFYEPSAFSVPIGRKIVWDDCFIPTGELSDALPFQRSISGCYESVGVRAEIGDYYMTVSDNFDRWVLYNGGGNGGFLCIEPQCGDINGLNTDGHRILLKGESDEFTIKIGRRI